MTAGAWGTPARRAGAAALVTVLYLLLDWGSFIYQLSPLGITPWNPPAGLALAAMLRGGAPMAAAVLVGSLAADPLWRPGAGPVGVSVAGALIFTAVYAVTALLLRRRFRLGLALARLRDVTVLLVGAAIAAALVAAALVGLYLWAGMIGLDRLWPAVARYWIGDMIGITVLAPLILIAPRWQGVPAWTVLAEMAAQALVLALALWLIFGVKEAEEFRFFYLLFLPMVWVAARFGGPGAAIGNAGVQLGLIGAVLMVGHGSTTVTAFQFLMLTLAMATLALGVSVDERRRAEAQLHERLDDLARLARLSMAGEMAAALAHELNQPLMAASAFARAGQRLLRTDPERADDAIGRAVAETQRAGDIIRALRQFIGLGQPRQEDVVMGEVVADTLALVAPECRRHAIRLTVAVDKGLPPVHADRAQAQQVLLNLVRNGAEAVADAPPSRRVVAISAWRSGGGDRQPDDGARPLGDGVCVEVADQGPGLGADVIDRLFSPFNTSKAEGMGLGLSISQSMVQAQGGCLWLDRSGDGGAAFRFFLPARPAETHPASSAGAD